MFYCSLIRLKIIRKFEYLNFINYSWIVRKRISMALIKRQIKPKKGLKEYTYLGCPLTNNRTPWCFRLCIPDTCGIGHCGRIAPHSLTSRIQQSIINYEK